ncbi:hypothetical protein JM93_02824 [Roseibium hamelinense]|uniref:Transmembrane protein n=1 Tax=Roseibium hamelinense TaxID=150831 RepID=A0A562SZ86_9HYPH|nr:hypothetical protein [Roseibium hamelinense]MTI43600.1 hypothetical protein [Roseibium hamelinense]TWI86116.1 hypothetical protein JM93_02824 [Roseibium hamelinense]
MSARYPLDPFALPNVPFRGLQSGLYLCSVAGCLKCALATIAIFLAAVLCLAVVFFIPVFIQVLARLNAVVVDDVAMVPAQFAGHLGELFFGTAIVAFAIVSFIASAIVASRDMDRYEAPQTRAQYGAHDRARFKQSAKPSPQPEPVRLTLDYPDGRP